MSLNQTSITKSNSVAIVPNAQQSSPTSSNSNKSQMKSKSQLFSLRSNSNGSNGSNKSNSGSSFFSRNSGSGSGSSSKSTNSTKMIDNSGGTGLDEIVNNYENDNRTNHHQIRTTKSSSGNNNLLSSPNHNPQNVQLMNSSRQSFRGNNTSHNNSNNNSQQIMMPNPYYNRPSSSNDSGHSQNIYNNSHYHNSNNSQLSQQQPNYDNLINYPPPPLSSPSSAGQSQISTTSSVSSKSSKSSPPAGPNSPNHHAQHHNYSPQHHHTNTTNSPTSLDRNSSVRLSLNTNNNNNNSSSSSYREPIRNSSQSQIYHQSQLYGQINNISAGAGVGVVGSGLLPLSRQLSLKHDDIINDSSSNSSKSTSPTGGTGSGNGGQQPINWVEILEPRSRTKMFANLSSGECRWEEPKGQTILRASNPNITQWWELFDQKTQRFYYYSAKDLKTIWQKPTSPDAVVVPLAKLQILKQNTQQDQLKNATSGHHNSHSSLQHKSSFDGSISSGHVTPSSPLSSPSHELTSNNGLSNGSRGLVGGMGGASNGGSRRYFAIRSPPIPQMSDAQTQTTIASAMVTKPTMVSRWTQTTNITPTHVRLDNVTSGVPKNRVNNNKTTMIDPGVNVRQLPNPNLNRPSLHHYLLSEARFARGINQNAAAGPIQDRLYDQVGGGVGGVGVGGADSGSNLVTGTIDDFYDLVANDTNYYDVYDRVTAAAATGSGPGVQFGDDDEDYYDEYDEDDLSYDEYDEDFSCDADDEFDVDGGEDSGDEDDDEDEDEDEEDVEDEDFDDEEDYESDEDIVVDHCINVGGSITSGGNNNNNNYENDIEFYASDYQPSSKIQPTSSGVQPLPTTTTRTQTQQPQLIRQSSAIITGTKHSATSKISINFLKNTNNGFGSNLVSERNDPANTRLINDPKQQQQQQQLLNDGLRMSASFTAVDFKRNAVGRSSYTPSMHHHYQQSQQQQQPQIVGQPSQSSQSQQQQPYSNPFNTGSLRSSTGRIQSSSSSSSSNRAKLNAAVTSSNIADRINLFNQKSSTPSTNPTTSGLQSPIITGSNNSRSSASPPPLQSSTPLIPSSEASSRPSRHSATSTIISPNDTIMMNNQQRHFSHQQSQPGGAGIISQYHQGHQGPSKSHSLTLISQQQQSQGGMPHGQNSPLSPSSSVSKIGNNLVNLNLSPVQSTNSIDSNNPYYYCNNLPLSPSSSNEQRSLLINSKRGNVVEQQRTSITSDPNTNTNKRNSSGIVSGSRSSGSAPSATITNSSTSGVNLSGFSSRSSNVFPNFNDSHLAMLNKTSVATTNNNNHPSSHQPLQQPTPAGKSKKSKQQEKLQTKNKAPPAPSGGGGGSKIKTKVKSETSPNKKKNEKKMKSKVSVTDSSGTAAPLNADNSIESFARECVARHRKGGIFSKKKTLKSMLTHTKKPLKKPMISTVSDGMLVKHSVNCFKMIQIFMGDRSVLQSPNNSIDSNPSNGKRNQQREQLPTVVAINGDGDFDEHRLMLDLINLCVQLVPLRDEVLVQVARQVTQNPSPESEQRGLELMCVLFWYFTASNKLAAHLHAFLIGHRNPFTAIVRRKFEQQMHRSRNTHSHLYFRKPHSPEEVGRVLRVVRSQHVGIFGEMLNDALLSTEVLSNAAASGNTEKNIGLLRQLPWPIVMLTEALLEPRHEDREGVFRCVGDMDDVHKLKIKIDTTLVTDPHFAEMIGCRRSSPQCPIPKLTDPHDIHVIASTLKLYFRELRDSVIPTELYLEALECAHSSQRACSLLDRLPSINRSTLCYLIRFLQVFSAPDHVQDTKMDDANLSMVWAPNVLRSMTNITNSTNIYEHTRAEMSLVRTLIQHLDTNAPPNSANNNVASSTTSTVKNSKM